MKNKLAGGMFLLSAIVCAGARGQQEPAAEGRAITPAGRLLMDATTKRTAVGALPVAFLRSSDTSGPSGKGRYLLVMNSGFGVQFNSEFNKAQQSIGVIDLNAKPEPSVVQNVYFPSPQSANVGVAFGPSAREDGSYELYVSGGYENKIWVFTFDPRADSPIQPGSPGPATSVTARAIELAEKGEASSKNYNGGKAALYPLGIGVTEDGILVAANNLGDSLSVIENTAAPKISRVDLHHGANPAEDIYPYGVVAVGKGAQARAYVSCWNDASIAVVSLHGKPRVSKYIAVDRHPTAMLLNTTGTRLFVVNSNADSVSAIDTRTETEVERIDVRLAEDALIGASPEGLALSEDGKTMYVANAHSNAIAVVELSNKARGSKDKKEEIAKSKVLGFIPTGQYPSAVAVVNGLLYVGNGKGTGVEGSSMIVNNSGRSPRIPNEAFPHGKRLTAQGGEYGPAMVVGNISEIQIPDEPTLANYTRQTMQNDGLMGLEVPKLFPNGNPIKHVIYVIKENRTYDQLFGDMKTAGNGEAADGEESFAIFGDGGAAKRPDGTLQRVTPNHHALVERFGLFDRFFVNSEASPDGHNWSTAAFSTDYVDKGFRWAYSGRGRTYDWEGFNRLPDYEPPGNLIVGSKEPDTLKALSEALEKHIPYRQHGTDLAEPKTLYLWDAAAKAGLTYRNYGEFVSVISEKDVEAAKTKKDKGYPDVSKAVKAEPTKESLEEHHSESFRSFDLTSPDSLTVSCYQQAMGPDAKGDPAVTQENSNENCRGNSRLGEWLEEFQRYVRDREAGRKDSMPALSVMRFPNDHTSGMKDGMPTPQFFVADNDYAVGRLVEAVSASPYWKDTAIFFVEDDSQDGPDHVDSHRSVAVVVSAYNRPGALIHKFHNTVSMIRTMELLLGIAPMNQLDATAVPMDIFQETPDLTPYHAILPTIAADNLINHKTKDATAAMWMKRSMKMNLAHADMADPNELNQIIWYACTGKNQPASVAAELPAYQVMRLGVAEEESKGTKGKKDDD
jgi:YVTN family beta-propeller protein